MSSPLTLHKAACCLLLTTSITLSIAYVDRTSSPSTHLSMQCPPCEQIHCMPRKPKRLRCPGGVTTGICGCCPVCARLEGDRCGGDWDHLGKCDLGLYCQYPLHTSAERETLATHVRHSRYGGHCHKMNISTNEVQSDQGWMPFCRPKCTPEFCMKHPRAACSAAENAEIPQSCQRECQHTSCQACRFVLPKLDCPKCKQDDFACLKQFGKCAKSYQCQRHKFPCRRNPIHEDNTGTFQCLVPEC